MRIVVGTLNCDARTVPLVWPEATYPTFYYGGHFEASYEAIESLRSGLHTIHRSDLTIMDEPVVAEDMRVARVGGRVVEAVRAVLPPAARVEPAVYMMAARLVCFEREYEYVIGYVDILHALTDGYLTRLGRVELRRQPERHATDS